VNQRNLKLVMFFLIFALGVANIVVTLANGGGVTSVGVLIGALLVALASMRIWLTLKGGA
jgi:hypothetical protein